MLDSDKKEFTEMLKATLNTYRVETTPDVARVWWGALNRFNIDQVRQGFNRFVGSKESKYPPVPAHIIEAIEASFPDGRVSADEAWAMIPRDEYASAVITNEMAEAYGIAKTLMDDGDMVAARRSFIDAYNRIVDQNKAAGKAPQWFPSLGHDAEGREAAMRDAVLKGRISQHHADGLLPAPKGHALLAQLPQMLMIEQTEMTEDEREKNHQRMLKIKEMLVRS